MARFILGLDFGPAADSTGFAVLEQSAVNEGATFAVRYLKRFSPGTTYAEIASAVNEVVHESNLGRPTVVTDITAVGPAIVRPLRKKITPGRITPVMITTGPSAVEIDGVWQAPKRDLVTTLQLHLQERRLAIAAAIADVSVLVRELAAFRARTTAAEGTLDWRDQPGDDLVLAIALACWWAERHPLWSGSTISVGGTILQELDKIFPHLAERRAW
jgi:hypothetical protein